MLSRVTGRCAFRRPGRPRAHGRGWWVSPDTSRTRESSGLMQAFGQQYKFEGFFDLEIHDGGRDRDGNRAMSRLKQRSSRASPRGWPPFRSSTLYVYSMCISSFMTTAGFHETEPGGRKPCQLAFASRSNRVHQTMNVVLG